MFDEIESVKQNYRYILLMLVFLVAIIIAYRYLSPFLDFFYDIDSLREFIRGFGVFSPILFIGVMIFQILAAPIPGHVIYLAGGYLFSPIPGIIYSLIGLFIGSFIAIYLSRCLGRPFVERMVSAEHLEKFDQLSSGYGLPAIFFIFLLPGFPDDALCFISGLTNLRLRGLLIAVMMGRAPSLILMVIAGRNLAEAEWMMFFLIILVISIVSLIALKYRKRIFNYGNSTQK
ncbi:MAG: Membrane protein DedA family [Candidatus Methanohalarchaeum thermophilum]|uniref:Membrane protein DedA family n=1 Tax=Methanohalarchaeum thermophilum TaxID=1903181 RepID=A0A1Q6DWW7_METT1|nr:MAG: Membrane protein DedA family [Candidatus Methanohalarchaeum thermophilum]